MYQTCLMILWILTGLIILNEKKFYDGNQLFAIFGSVAVCIIGIKLLTMKTNLLKIEAARDRAESFSSHSKAPCDDRIHPSLSGDQQKKHSTFVSEA